MFRSWLARASSVAALAWACAAHATLITQWDYALLTRFDGNNTFTVGGGSTIQTDTQVSWGDPAGNVFVPGSSRSGITLADNDTAPGGNDAAADPITGTVTTNGTALAEIGLGAFITHHNNPVSWLDSKLSTTEIASTLTLVPNTPPLGGQVGPSTLYFSVHFVETTNAEPCVAPSPAGNPCNDIFAIDSGDAFNQTFDFDGRSYFVNIFPIVDDGISSFLALSDAECAAAGTASGCIGFTTVEGQDTTVRFGFSLSAAPLPLIETVPEPQPAALVLAALAAMMLVLRRTRG